MPTTNIYHEQKKKELKRYIQKKINTNNHRHTIIFIFRFGYHTFIN